MEHLANVYNFSVLRTKHCKNNNHIGNSSNSSSHVNNNSKSIVFGKCLYVCEYAHFHECKSKRDVMKETQRKQQQQGTVNEKRNETKTNARVGHYETKKKTQRTQDAGRRTCACNRLLTERRYFCAVTTTTTMIRGSSK